MQQTLHGRRQAAMAAAADGTLACARVARPDGPSQTLLAFMGEHNFKAPDGWSGYRELTEK